MRLGDKVSTSVDVVSGVPQVMFKAVVAYIVHL